MARLRELHSLPYEMEYEEELIGYPGWYAACNSHGYFNFMLQAYINSTIDVQHFADAIPLLYQKHPCLRFKTHLEKTESNKYKFMKRLENAQFLFEHHHCKEEDVESFVQSWVRKPYEKENLRFFLLFLSETKKLLIIACPHYLLDGRGSVTCMLDWIKFAEKMHAKETITVTPRPIYPHPIHTLKDKIPNTKPYEEHGSAFLPPDEISDENTTSYLTCTLDANMLTQKAKTYKTTVTGLITAALGKAIHETAIDLGTHLPPLGLIIAADLRKYVGMTFDDAMDTAADLLGSLPNTSFEQLIQKYANISQDHPCLSQVQFLDYLATVPQEYWFENAIITGKFCSLCVSSFGNVNSSYEMPKTKIEEMYALIESSHIGAHLFVSCITLNDISHFTFCHAVPQYSKEKMNTVVKKFVSIIKSV